VYLQYFGLSEKPFSIAVNPRYLFMSSRHRDALAHLLYGVGAGGGFILLTGEVGTGKTTINRCLLEQLPDDTDVAIILNPTLNARELLATVCDELHVDYNRQDPSLKVLTDALHGYLLQNHQAGRKTVLMIDEAQHLDFDVLEQVRLLTNLETNTQKLLQIILIGQPELAAKLQRPELRQLNQRITARYELRPLNLVETRLYIQHRLQVAGLMSGNELFPDSVVRGVHRYSRGIPRLINVLCERMLLGAYGQNKLRADRGLLREAGREVQGESRVLVYTRKMKAAVGSAALLAVLLLGGTWYVATTAPGENNIPAGPGWGVSEGSSKSPTANTESVAADGSVAAGLSAAPINSPADAMFVRGQGFDTLWSLLSSAPAPVKGCDSAPVDGIYCQRAQQGTWDEIQALRRPALLQLVTEDRMAMSVVVLGLMSDRALLWYPGGNIPVLLSELGRLWTGDYVFLGRLPSGYNRALARGDQSPQVAQVAKWFATLDGQAQALTGEVFSASLQQRVILFQQQHGLEDDGVVGEQTLKALDTELSHRMQVLAMKDFVDE